MGVFVPADNHELYDPLRSAFPFSMNNGPQVAARAGYLFTPYLVVELELDASVHVIKNNDVALIYAARGHVLVQRPRRVAPFAVAGSGVFVSRSDVLGDDTEPMGYVGAGVKYYWKYAIAVRLDARLIRSLPDEPEATGGGGTSHEELSVGLLWQLGG